MARGGVDEPQVAELRVVVVGGLDHRHHEPAAIGADLRRAHALHEPDVFVRRGALGRRDGNQRDRSADRQTNTRWRTRRDTMFHGRQGSANRGAILHHLPRIWRGRETTRREKPVESRCKWAGAARRDRGCHIRHRTGCGSAARSAPCEPAFAGHLPVDRARRQQRRHRSSTARAESPIYRSSIGTAVARGEAVNRHGDAARSRIAPNRRRAPRWRSILRTFRPHGLSLLSDGLATGALVCRLASARRQPCRRDRRGRNQRRILSEGNDSRSQPSFTPMPSPPPAPRQLLSRQ